MVPSADPLQTLSLPEGSAGFVYTSIDMTGIVCPINLPLINLLETSYKTIELSSEP